MDVIKFTTAMSQICLSSHCENCVLRLFCRKPYHERTKEDAEKVEKVVEEWLKDHPVKTRQSEFLKEFPNAVVGYGTINILPCWLDKTLAQDCDGAHPRECVECKKAYWGKEVE